MAQELVRSDVVCKCRKRKISSDNEDDAAANGAAEDAGAKRGKGAAEDAGAKWCGKGAAEDAGAERGRGANSEPKVEALVVQM